MKTSVKVELSEDGLDIRPKDRPTSWPVASVEDYAESKLKADVAEFIPRQDFKKEELCMPSGDELEPPNADILSSSAPPELEGMWTEVKRRHRDITPKKITFDEITDHNDKEELDFMFDEELPELSTGRNNNFTNEWSVNVYYFT